ncbi:MAG: tetratricopeptide repeat protein [Planctomycetota bacterium]
MTVGRWVLVSCLAIGAVPAQDDFWAEELRSAERSLLKGRLAEARDLLEEIVLSRDEDPDDERPAAAVARRAAQGLLELRLVRGEYREVLEAIDALPLQDRQDSGYRRLLANARFAVGDYAGTRVLWQALHDADPADQEARYRLGLVLRETGDRQAAFDLWRAAAEQHVAEDDAKELAYTGMCLAELGTRSDVEAASAWLARAVRSDPDRPEARTAYGRLQFRAYGEANGFPSGERDLQKVLQENGEYHDALLELYRLRRANFQLDPRKTEDLLGRALSLNPNSVAALIERAVVLLDDRRFADAASVLDRALEINPRDKRALAHRAAAAMLLGKAQAEAELRARARAVDPGFADIDRLFGDHLVALYRFGDAVPFYQRALDAEPGSVAAMHGLAKALIYSARNDEALAMLQRAAEAERGFVHPWRSNALAVEQLLEEEYQEVAGDSFAMHLHDDDREVLLRYLLPVFREAKEVLGDKYGYKPAEHVSVEVFHTWADFSVRTIGFRGFSALGACFGPLITMVSPADRVLRGQDFVWASTAWHEYAHVLTLALSKHRVPRWLTEGFSVYEEGQKNPAWERGMERDLWDAYHNQEVVPLLQLNSLFRGPRILFGYYQGGLIVEYLAGKHGFDRVVELLRGYGDDRPTGELFEATFGVSPREFDREFLAWVADEKLRGLKLVPRFTDASIERLTTQLLREPDDLDARVNLGWAFLQRANAIDAADQLRRVLGADPNHPRGLLLHAELLRRRGAVDEASAAFRAGFAAGADDFDSRIAFGKLLEELGNVDDAAREYQRAKACWPRCTDQTVAPNLLLAVLLREEGRESEAMMELKGYVARTGRAFEPRLQLAAMERELGNREEEARLLQEAAQIDPFMRDLHVRLGDALEALGRPEEARTEFEVALAVRPAVDRAYLQATAAEIPDPQTAAEREARAEIYIRLARLAHAKGDDDEAFRELERAIAASRDGSAAGEAAQLLQDWR